MIELITQKQSINIKLCAFDLHFIQIVAQRVERSSTSQKIFPRSLTPDGCTDSV